MAHTRDFDVILYGATGFTGRQTAHYFAEHAPRGLKWAIAGRSPDKLQRLLDDLGPQHSSVPTVQADSSQPDTVDAMCARARVLLTTAGPYALYGDPVVDACVRHQTHYVDITGETPWVKRVIDRHHDEAARTGTRIIPFCGFDSVPSDIGALAAVHALRARGSEDIKRISASFTAKGGFNGGTVASMVNMAESGQTRALSDTLLLNPEHHRSDEERRRSRDLRKPIFDEARGRWLAPFFMAPVNTRVVRRSNALFADYDRPYGPEFTYQEAMEVKSRMAATLTTGALGLLAGSIQGKAGRALVKRLAPDPGQGPSDEAMDGGFMRARLLAEGADGQRLMMTMQSDGDPGNRVTVKILCESALLLALEPDRLPGGPERGGVLTPATGLGLPLMDRLERAGFELRSEHLPDR